MLEVGPAASGFSTSGTLILDSSESVVNMLIGIRNSKVFISVYFASHLLSIFSLQRMKSFVYIGFVVLILKT